MQIDEDVPVLMRDGTRISAKLFRPVGDAFVPVVLSFSACLRDIGRAGYPAVLNINAGALIGVGLFVVSR